MPKKLYINTWSALGKPDEIAKVRLYFKDKFLEEEMFPDCPHLIAYETKTLGSSLFRYLLKTSKVFPNVDFDLHWLILTNDEVEDEEGILIRNGKHRLDYMSDPQGWLF